MIDFGVIERKAAELEQRMAGCKLYEKDIEEKIQKQKDRRRRRRSAS